MNERSETDGLRHGGAENSEDGGGGEAARAAARVAAAAAATAARKLAPVRAFGRAGGAAVRPSIGRQVCGRDHRALKGSGDRRRRLPYGR